ncbi:hypothetical protein [Clostridium botulinum]|uniref:hypothetical protein n=1 Tax=Clostridium botulinum TaxID=1491 RepID=UPI0006A71989|nr:hypothetical protein [Clostridium botulinum]KAI3350136.1 hypothetical protein CIT18_04465 [Clostridium botulinum]KOM88951.1 hypothetical protein ACP51_04250 [Clostridium botulinum]KOR63517.1 hypothetical protein ADT22_03035 [Clostridium botulinum]MCS6111532.1 hypothetical protein [Clostridium botulinum]NFE10952.1 hypothetical protein [Clostridium botulinum]
MEIFLLGLYVFFGWFALLKVQDFFGIVSFTSIGSRIITVILVGWIVIPLCVISWIIKSLFSKLSK